MLNIPDVHRRLSAGLPLTVDEQRELWNIAHSLANDVDSYELSDEGAAITMAGPLPPIKKRCEACGGEGERYMRNLGCTLYEYMTCPVCKGTRYAS